VIGVDDWTGAYHVSDGDLRLKIAARLLSALEVRAFSKSERS
jgi:hypothetical protein